MSSLIVCAKTHTHGSVAGGSNITLHSLDCHVRDLNEKVHLM